MRYLCLGFHDEKILQAMNEAERCAMLEENTSYQRMLEENGHFLNGTALQPIANAATLRFDGGKMLVTDGPFAETKEQLGGVMILEANDLNHAIQLMSKLPCMRVGGSLEIRPIDEALSGRPK